MESPADSSRCDRNLSCKGRIINIRADHLAILPRKQGACSLSDGAGLLINSRHDFDNKEVLTIFTTTIHNDFIPGSTAIETDAKFKRDLDECDTKKAGLMDDRSVDVPVTATEPLQSPSQTLTLKDGTTITITPPDDGAQKTQMELSPDGKTLYIDGRGGETEQTRPEETPKMQDNPEIVKKDEIEEGEDEFVITLRNLRNAAEILVNSVRNAVVLNPLCSIMNATDGRGGMQFRQTPAGEWESASTGRPVGSFDSEEVENINKERRRLRSIAADVQRRIVELQERVNAATVARNKPEQADLDEMEKLAAELAAAQKAVLGHMRKYGAANVNPKGARLQTMERAEDVMLITISRSGFSPNYKIGGL